jgi:hypothetical protein
MFAAGTVAYDDVTLKGVARLQSVKILKFGAPLFFANVSVLKVLQLWRDEPLQAAPRTHLRDLCIAPRPSS